MAQPIPLDVPVRDPRAELQSRLDNAPAEHAEALLAGYEVLQGLHDCGLFDLMRGALGSKDKVLEIAVGAADSPASVRGVRNLILLINMLGEIDPEVLRTFTRAAPEAFNRMIRQPQSPGMRRLIGDFLWNKDFRHGLAAVNTMLEVFGKSWSCASKTVAREGSNR